MAPPLAAVPLHHLSAADADHRGGDDVLRAVHLHRLPAYLGPDARRAGQCHAADGDAWLSARHYLRAVSARVRRSATAMIPFLLGGHRDFVVWHAAPEVAARIEAMTDALSVKAANPQAVLTGSAADYSEGMSYLETLPRRLVTLYLPLSLDFDRAVVSVLLDGADIDQAGRSAPRYGPCQSVLDHRATLKHIYNLLFDTYYPRWLWNTMLVAVSAPRAVDHRQRIRRLCDRAVALPGRAVGRRCRSFSRIWCRRRFCSFRYRPSCSDYGLFDTPFALILTYPTILIPFSTWLLIGYFKTIPFELEECALIDGAGPLANPARGSSFRCPSRE